MVFVSQPFQVEFHPYLDIHEVGHVWDDLEYKEYSYNEPTKELPLKIFEAAPPFGKRIVTLQIELEGTDKASLVFSGRLYAYRDRFIEKDAFCKLFFRTFSRAYVSRVQFSSGRTGRASYSIILYASCQACETIQVFSVCVFCELWVGFSIKSCQVSKTQ